MFLKTDSYAQLRAFLDAVPVVETHEHYAGMFQQAKSAFNVINYYQSDFMSASFGCEKESERILNDDRIDFDMRCDYFMKIYRKSNLTSYARASLAGLRACWGIDELTPETLRFLQEKLPERTPAFYDKMMRRFGIKAKIANIYVGDVIDLIEGRQENLSEYSRLAFPLPVFHSMKTKADIQVLEPYLDRAVVCLDDYLEAFENLLRKAVDFGVVCLKDQSAYRRALDYKNPDRSEAEKAFNLILSNPHNFYGTEQVRPLDDWLFNHFMRLAAKYKLPVQLHTGFQTMLRNDIRNANAVNLIPLMELHQDVRFSLFHGNYPYMDEYLFLGKNYPNVVLDLNFVQMLDPIYSVELIKRAVVAVPHSKVMAFGGDCGNIEMAVGYLIAARDNTAYALSELVECGWLSVDQAKQVAADWFYNNPNEFYNLGLKPF